MEASDKDEVLVTALPFIGSGLKMKVERNIGKREEFAQILFQKHWARAKFKRWS